MVRRVLGGTAAALLALSLATGVAVAGNPAGTGQPGAECGEEDSAVEPNGFLTGGFETAEEHYAGEGEAPLTHAGSDHAVSQYDVACYQVTQHRPS
jgi:hypothetical protein